MAGHFEVIDDADGSCRARLIDESGNVLALSDRYGNTDAAARGIRAIREIAGTGLIDDGRETSARG